MPRRSSASLSLAAFNADARRLDCPAELSGIEAEIFRQTVASVSAGHFVAEDLVLLTQFARSAALARRASEELMVSATVGSVVSPWLAVHQSATKTMMQLSVRLRIGPRSRTPDDRRRSAQVGPTSYYDQMRLKDAKG
jgi:hypothetical protein